MKYRKKPVIVEAIQYKDSNDYDNIDDIYIFTNHSIRLERGIGFNNITIPTLFETDILVSEGDYIIKNENGEIYTCKPDIFHKTYEKIKE